MDVKLPLCSRPQMGPGYSVHASELTAWSKSMCVKQKRQLTAVGKVHIRWRMLEKDVCIWTERVVVTAPPSSMLV